MSSLVHNIKRSLSSKVIIAVCLVFLLCCSIALFLVIRVQQKQLMEDALAFVTAFSQITKLSIHHDMLAGRMGDIQKALESIGAAEAISKVYILNADNRISYSSEGNKKGTVALPEELPCINCHKQPAENGQKKLMAEKKWTVVQNPDGYRSLAYIEPIANEPDCYTAACHVHKKEQKILASLITDFSLRSIDTKIRNQTFRFLLLILGIAAILAFFLSLVLWKFILQPFSRLAAGLKQVASGDLRRKVAVESDDEIGRLAGSFNEMTDELHAARNKMEDWTRSLEEEVERKTKLIRKTQDKLIQSEKLSALGQLTADIAHEIRNPLMALGGFGRRLQKQATDPKQQNYAALIVAEAERLEHILRDVLILSWEPRIEFEKSTLEDVVAASIALYGELCEEHGITIGVTNNTDLPVLIEREHTRQAVDNLVTNAIDAMPDGGNLHITIDTENVNELIYVVLRVEDNGTGVAEQDLERIFEPFFTTKRLGQGTGLGLSISRKIITEHGGFIKARNRNTGGFSISLFFPYQANDTETKPCWEFMRCGRDKDGSIICPAYPHFGRACWAVAGTLCAGKIQGTFAQKISDCKRCEFFKNMYQPPAGNTET